jgi:1,4-dihydroxy-6-naphthoate synthase
VREAAGSVRAVRVRLGHSPDPDDAFMFWALMEGRVDTRGFEFEQVTEDIQTLNLWALEGRLEVTALSLHAYPFVQDRYALLPHGASMGDGYGPVVVAERALSLDQLRETEILVPGARTTAFLVLRMAIGDFAYREAPLDQIADAVVEGRADAGLLIHEGQLTYAEEGLRKIVDLGEWWADHTAGLPLPLGGNIIRRDLGPEMIQVVSKILHDSIAHALSHREQAVEYALQFGRGLDRARTDKFVGMYVNKLTLSYGERGRQAVERLLGDAFERGFIPQRVPVEFAA